jgi:4-hydroxy-tetrahydrodipicolinate reductase
VQASPAGYDRPVRLLLNGRGGKVGSVLGPELEAVGHELVDDLGDAEAMVDFTAPDAVVANVAAAVAAGVPSVVGTTGAELGDVGEQARAAGVPVFFAPNFALGAVLMMRFAAEASRHLPRAEIIEAHNEAKKDAPSGTARATAEAMEGDPTIHSIRLPGLVAHQEVLLAGDGQLLTIRHDAFSREAYAPGVLLALERLPTLPPGLTVGLDALLG